MSSNKSIIVKKVKKHAGGSHHGGSWKVAYADFVTAMMAFFLLLWLLSMVSDEKRARLSAYFKYFSLYDSGGTSWMEKSSEIFGEPGENRQKVINERIGKTPDNADSLDQLLQSLGNALKQDLAQKLGDLKDHVIIDIVEEGIRIQMVDKEGSLIFDRGSRELTDKGGEILGIISQDIRRLRNRVIIEGHTDALPYAGRDYSNWELSTERASSARKYLESSGLDPARIVRVAGYADTDPLIKDDPQDPRNRRISIILKVPDRQNVSQAAAPGSQNPLREVSKEMSALIEGEGKKTLRVPFPMINNPPVISQHRPPGPRRSEYDSLIKEGKGDGALVSTDENASPEAGSSLERDDSDRTGSSPVIMDLSPPISIGESIFPGQ
ncbi:MAG: OmpA family protein [Nitrospiraceae bacterium]|nr:MAG: OmpA family protein [Nitrospiraceae bacterium]